MTKEQISKILVSNKFKLDLSKTDVGIMCVDIPKCSELILEQIEKEKPNKQDFLKTMLNWHDEFYKAGHFKIELDHEQSEYLSWLAYRLAKVHGN